MTTNGLAERKTRSDEQSSRHRQGLDDHAHYFKVHQRRMPYAEFQEQGYPIGSGTVESGVNFSRCASPVLVCAGLVWARNAC
jgi:hypothetical protein